MRILLVTDNPLFPGAYGIQGAALAQHLLALGHTVRLFAPTYTGRLMTVEGVEVLGGVGMSDPVGSGAMGTLAEQFKADLLLTLKDPYAYNPDDLRRLPVPWVAIVPLDAEPLDLMTKAHLAYASAVIAVTKSGQAMLQHEGIEAYYAPHGIDTAFWTPGDKIAARRELNLPDDRFVAAFVGDNNSRPSRKNLDQLILAWAQFVDQEVNRGDVLYLHTSLGPLRGGLDLELMLRVCALPAVAWRSSPQMLYETSNIPRERLRTLYQAADVLVAPGNEGFCVPVVEAQACGCPVIASDFAGLRETALVGWKIQPGRGGETVWQERGAFWFRPSRAALIQALSLAKASAGSSDLRDAAHTAAQRYALPQVFGQHWTPVLQDLEGLLMQARLERVE